VFESTKARYHKRQNLEDGNTCCLIYSYARHELNLDRNICHFCCKDQTADSQKTFNPVAFFYSMHYTAIIALAVLVIASGAYFSSEAHAQKGTWVDEVMFIQYVDEDTALEEMRSGNLDVYYYKIPPDRLESAESNLGLQIFESVGGGTYSLLINPAESAQFNPFSETEARFALNYLVDRELIVNEFIGGWGTPIFSNYGPHDPDYLNIISTLELFNFRYNPALADQMISDSLQERGAEKIDGLWHFEGKPIEIVIFIRSDDPVRTSIGEVLGSELERIGFVVKKDYGDLNKAFVSVYGSNPSDLVWHIYTEEWAGTAALVKYDQIGLSQMYSPWFSVMPGFNDPSYWNYENALLDNMTQRIYAGDYASFEERADLVRMATSEGISESVRIFLASKVNLYAANDNVDGIINDFGAGIPTRFTPINARTATDSLTVGVKQIYQGAWNPIMGFSDIYSVQIWTTLHDPAIFVHPYNGDSVPVRSDWYIETLGPHGAFAVPQDAMLWNTTEQKWNTVKPGTNATSIVTYDLKYSNWHHGAEMDINDLLYALYFTLEWGSEPDENDRTVDAEFTPRASQALHTIKGLRIVDDDTIQMYVDYWHFDNAEIANWASLWSSMPWEIYVAMEQAVLDGKTSFSRSGAASKNVGWLSLIIPNDSRILMEYLEDFKENRYIPPAIADRADAGYATSRYDSAIAWIAEKNHAVISNGPFYLEGYSPESRLIKVRAFDDESYPFDAGHWSKFEDVSSPRIRSVDIPDVVRIGEPADIAVATQDGAVLRYFVTDSQGRQVASGTNSISNNKTIVSMGGNETGMLGRGANNIKLFVMSDKVLRPDIYSTSFLALGLEDLVPDVQHDEIDVAPAAQDYTSSIMAAGIIASIVLVLAYRSRRLALSRK